MTSIFDQDIHDTAIADVATHAERCKMNVLGTYWTVCGAPSDGPCYCDTHVAAHTGRDCNYYGNSTGGFDADEFAPTLILSCEACHAELPYLGDGDEQVIEGVFTLGEYAIATCSACGATFGEGDELGVTGMDIEALAPAWGSPPSIDAAFELSQRQLAAIHGWPALVGD